MERRVTGFSPGVSVTVAPPLSAAAASGNSYQISKTFRDDDVDLAVNSALRDMNPERVIQSFATANAVGDSYTISVPSAASNAIAQLVKVDRSWGTTNSPYDYIEMFQGHDYLIDEANGRATLRLAETQASGNIVRFHYRRPAADLGPDTDTTDEPISLILAGARKWLAIAEGDQQLAERFAREFEQAKHDYVKSRAAKTVKTPIIRVVN